MAAAAAKGGGGKKSKAKIEEEVEAKAECGTCKKEVIDFGVECEICDTWFHSKCEGISVSAYEAMQENKALHWYCAGCSSGVVKTWRKLKDKQDQLEREVNNLKEEVKNVRMETGKIGRLEEDFAKEKIRANKLDVRVRVLEEKDAKLKGEQTQVQIVHKEVEDLKKSFAQIMEEQKEEAKSDGGKRSRYSEREMQGKMIEMMEREKRRSNLIIMGIKECGNTQEEKDIVEEILKELIVEADVKYEIVGRVGRNMEQQDMDSNGKARPLRVSFVEVRDRKRLLERAKNLKNTGHKKIFLVPDMTRMQQEEDKKLRDKLKEIRVDGKRFAKISKGEIVDEKGEVLYSSQK